MTSVYLAGRFASAPMLELQAGEFRAAGHTVTSRWHTGSHGDPHGDVDLNAYDMPRYTVEDLDDIRAADTIVSFTQDGGGRGGRHVEFGVALALGKRLVLVGPREHVFHTLAHVEQYDTVAGAIHALGCGDCATLARRDPHPAELPDRTTRHFLGVTDSGLRIGTVLTGRFRGEHRPLPMAALRGDMADATGGEVFDPLLASESSPLFWPVSAEVYRVFQEIDDEDDPDDEDEVDGQFGDDDPADEPAEIGEQR